MQRDPLGYVDSMNLYGYVVNNPINATDPLGLRTLIIHGIGGHEKGYSGELAKQLVSSGEGVTEVIWSGNMADTQTVSASLSAKLKQERAIADAQGDTLNVIGHSWGSVIGYKSVSGAGVNIDNFVTLGSPLALKNKPTNVTQWTNYWSNRDPISWPSLSVEANQYRTTLTHTEYWNNLAVDKSILNLIATQDVLIGQCSK